jgi:serine/threonine-protein kinase
LFGDTVKITDFGLSSMTTGKLQFHRRAGTVAYAAPEVFRGQLSDKMDQYALAVSYVELRTGSSPFPKAPVKFSSLYQVPSPELGMLTAEEQPIILRALERLPHARWSTCGEMMNQLSALVN